MDILTYTPTYPNLHTVFSKFLKYVSLSYNLKTVTNSANEMTVVHTEIVKLPDLTFTLTLCRYFN